jgi:gamma-glutamylputrescine oxidase
VARRDVLSGATSADVCVVGGGIAGCSAALHLAERGYKVVLLEGHRIGWGASGRNGGQALVGVATGQGKLERLIGPEDARRVWDISVEGLTLMRELIAGHGIDCDWVSGTMQTAIKPRQDAEIREELETLRTKYGYEAVAYVPRDEVRSILPTERYISGLRDSKSGHLHPLNYTLGLAAAAEKHGARMFESTRVLGYRNDREVCVRTPAGEVHCKHLVLCGNVYLGDVAPSLASKIMAVSTYIVATEKLGEARVTELIRDNCAVADMNWVLDYFRRSADHRLLFGGRVSYSSLASFDLPEVTRRRMVAVFPQLEGVKLDYSWGGEVDITMSRAPNFGRLAPNVYFLQGFSGHGIALAGVAGKLAAEAIAGTAERFDVFARIPHRSFPGGAVLRRPALVLAMLYYRLCDLL